MAKNRLMPIWIYSRGPRHSGDSINADCGRGQARIEPEPCDRLATHAMGRNTARRILGETLHFGQPDTRNHIRSEEHTSELPSLMRISYAVFCLTINLSLLLHHLFYSFFLFSLLSFF